MATLREKSKKKSEKESERPYLLYFTVIGAALFSVILGYFSWDLSLNILSEIVGAAFTLFVIDALLVKSKAKRWHIVDEHIDYLIGRTINRIRDGIATRVFLFKPSLTTRLKEQEVIYEIRTQREKFLNELSSVSAEKLAKQIDTIFLNEEAYAYFDEKAEDIWNLVNMKYSEYLAPNLISLLIELHTNLEDVCSHIRFYKKAERFPAEKEHYENLGLLGIAKNMKEIIRIVVKLKEEGYSDSAKVFDIQEELL